MCRYSEHFMAGFCLGSYCETSLADPHPYPMRPAMVTTGDDKMLKILDYLSKTVTQHHGPGTNT